MKQHKVPRFQPRLRQRFAQQVLRRQALEHHGRTSFKTDSIRQLANAFCGHDAQLAVTARWLAGVGRAVADFKVRHTLTHGFDHA